MEYLQPMETLHRTIKQYQVGIITLAVLLALAVVGVPIIMQRGSCFVSQEGGHAELLKTMPWKLLSERVEGFTRAYLSARFEWNPNNFDEKRKALSSLVTEQVIGGLKSSISTFDAVAKAQAARSYFILEGQGYSNIQHRVEVKVTRVLRIKDAALPTPLLIRFSYQEAAVTDPNPYGLLVDSVEEVPQENAADSSSAARGGDK